MRKRIPEVVFWLAALVGVMLLMAFLLQYQVSTEWGFVCENTGSRHGYRDCRFGSRTAAWTNTSELESVLRRNYPQAVSNRWVSYNGTGRNVFGMAVVYGYGFPALVHIKPEDL